MKTHAKTSQAFGKVMKKWRIARKISQQELAQMCELDRTFISLMETGKRQPTLTTVFSISRALKVNPEELVRQTSRQIKFSNSRRSLTVGRRL